MSRAHRRSRWLIAALTALLWGSLGITCEDIISQPDPSRPSASLRVTADQGFYYAYQKGFVASVDLVVITNKPFQAWDLKVSWNSDDVYAAVAIPHPEFDDDESLFGDTQLKAKSLSKIVDLRHGSGAASGTVRVATVVFISFTTKPIEVRVLGEIAAPDGALFNVVVSESATIGP